MKENQVSTAKLENYKHKCKKFLPKTASFMDVTNTKRQHLLPHGMLSMNSSSSCGVTSECIQGWQQLEACSFC